MLKYLSFITIGFLLATPIYADGKYGLGRTALPSEIQAWDIDVLPDGRGLPAGKGDAIVGEEIFANKCASCHGDFAEGVGNWPALAGGFDTLADEDPVKTVGSYWPYLSTLWDYINRSMPFGGAHIGQKFAQSLNGFNSAAFQLLKSVEVIHIRNPPQHLGPL